VRREGLYIRRIYIIFVIAGQASEER